MSQTPQRRPYGAKQPQELLERESARQLPLTRINFILMAASALLIVLGFLLMTGSANDGTVFNADIFSARRTVVGPTIAFAGYIFMGVAIMYTPRSRRGQGREAAADE